MRNTQEHLDLIDTIIEAAISGGPVQVEIEAKFVEITQNNLKELSFDWLLGPGNTPGSKSVFFSGGTSGTSPSGRIRTTSRSSARAASRLAANPVTGGNPQRQSRDQPERDRCAALRRCRATRRSRRRIAALSGVFTDPQFQLVIRALNQKKGVDLLSAPRVTTKSGQRAVIEIIREFRYPTEFDPPQIPQTFGNTGGGISLTGAGTQSSTGSFPVTPTTPTAFETRNTGVTLEVEPVVGPDGYTIDLNLVPQVVEFEGFINYGSPIQSTTTNAAHRRRTTRRHHAERHQPADLQHPQGARPA